MEAAFNSRRKILDAAEALFAAQGFDATSVRQIADRVGMTVPALYYHFGSKRGVLKALIEEHLEAREASIAGALSGSREAASAEAVLVGGLRSYLRFMTDEEGMTGVLFRDVRLLADEELFALLRASESRIAERLAEVLSRGMEEGAFRRTDSLLTAHLLLAAARCALLSRTIVELGYPREDAGEAALDLLLRGILADRSESEG